MKKYLLSTTIIIAWTLVTAGVASANGGPHTGYTASMDACSGCHRANTGLGDEAFSPADTVTMCMACHGADGLGANTNVADGVYDSHRDDAAANGDVGAANTPDGAGLLGGGFVTYRGKPVTSAHPLTGLATAPRGNGAARGQSGTLLAAPLTCISCHDPHGSGNYRNLRHTVNGQPVTVAQVDEGAAKDYDTEQWGAGTDSLCAACHSAYNATSAGSGSDGAMVASGGYTHRVGMPYNFGDNQNPETIGFQGYKLPLAQSGNGDLVACMTCHLPHGSSAAALSGDGSNLLRIDNSGVCQVCHQL